MGRRRFPDILVCGSYRSWSVLKMSVFAGFWTASSSAETNALAARCSDVVAEDLGSQESFATICTENLYVAFSAMASSQISTTETGVLLLGYALIPGCKSDVDDAEALLGALGSDTRLVELANEATGNFSAILWDARLRCVYLLTDGLATRPIYFKQINGAVLFASCLKYMKAIVDDLTIDIDGILEDAALKYCLGTKTPYAGMHAADAATLYSFSFDDSQGSLSRPYFDWRRTELPAETDIDKLTQDLHEALRHAVRIRATRHGAEFCMLSGGMDSRYIAFLLAEAGHKPATICFGARDLSDMVIAEMLAEYLPGPHLTQELDLTAFASAGGSTNIVAQILDEKFADRPTPAYVWSGGGGSVGLGGVYMTESHCEHCEAKELNVAAGELLSHNNRALAQRIVSAVDDTNRFLLGRVKVELESISISNRSQLPYRFLMLNDQRRHLYDHYENIARNKIELVTPFFDLGFLKTMLRCPPHEVLFHRIYNRAFELLPKAAHAVPWQTYPGHVPCPLPLPSESQLQWGRPMKTRDRRILRSDCVRLIGAALGLQWPGHVLKRGQTLLASMAVLLGYDDAAYLVRQAARIHDHCMGSAGMAKTPAEDHVRESINASR